MSKAQMKKAAAKLEAYLGRDQHGLALLANVSRAANDIRVASARNAERAEKAESEIEPIKIKLRTTQKELEESRQALRVSHDKQKQAESAAAIMRNEIAALKRPTPKVLSEEPQVITASRIDDVITRARNIRKMIPNDGRCEVKSVRFKDTKGHNPPVFDIDKIMCNSLSDEDIWYLGAAIFLTLCLSETLVLVKGHPMSDKRYYGQIKGRTFNSLITWFSENIDHKITLYSDVTEHAANQETERSRLIRLTPKRIKE